MASRVRHRIDFDRDGRQEGYLRVPQSHNRGGWATIEIPIVVLRNGSGPTVLFTAGIHGDEYEGQIAALRFAREVDPAHVQGRVILMPAVDVPACLAMTRLCPLDQRDMNRTFPGDPRGSFTQVLAHFIDSEILPLVDVSVDLHSGGTGMEAAISTNMHLVPDPALRARTIEAAAAFGAPYNVAFHGVDEGQTLTSAVERRGILSLGTELGGAGRVSIEGVRIAERGMRNLLRHLGMMEGAPDTRQADGSSGTRHMVVPDDDCYLFAPADGLFEPRHRPGDLVEAGEIAGHIHFVEDLERASIPLRYARAGQIWMTLGPGRPQKGDPVTVVMTPMDG